MTSKIEIIDTCEQGSDEWKALRLGVPSASCFADVMAGGGGKTRAAYMRKLAGEIITGVPREDYRNGAMDRGNAVEPELRATFAIETGLSLRQIAFARRRMPFGVIGASPDALVGDDAGVELKSAAPHVLIEMLQADRIPPEHMLQIQGSMLVLDRKEWWIGVGYPGMPMFKRCVKRDTSHCARLEVGLRAFQEELDEMVRWLKNYGRE